MSKFCLVSEATIVTANTTLEGCISILQLIFVRFANSEDIVLISKQYYSYSVKSASYKNDEK